MNGTTARAGDTNDAAADGDGFGELVLFAAAGHDLSIRAYRGHDTTVRSQNLGVQRAIRNLCRPS
jgi:hypothetical protein